MSQHSEVRNAMHEALDTYGAGSGGSRNIGGSHALYGQLEQSLADARSRLRAGATQSPSRYPR
nr:MULTISPECIES: hypothetical protein [unclassified Pseudomonas]